MTKPCSQCKVKKCIKQGKPCKRIEKLLPKPNTGKSNKEIPTNQDLYTNCKTLEYISLGKRKHPIHYNDNLESE
jgi:hypothetical protein